MKTLYNWKKGLFSSTYEIYTNKRLIGTLNNKAFCKTSSGIINNHKYIFQTTGLLKPQTYIIDADNPITGSITYGPWSNKATITLSGKIYHWKYSNTWNTKWLIYGIDGTIIQNTGSTNSGITQSNYDNDALLMCGLFIDSHFHRQSTAVWIPFAAAIFIPIWLMFIN